VGFPHGVKPKYPLKIKLTFEFDCWGCPEANRGSAVFTFADTTCDVCRGARDLQLALFAAMGFIEAATDEAWAKKVKEMNL
jgi:hypothetical protein